MSTYVSSQNDWGKTSRRTRVTSLCSRPASSSVSGRPRCFSSWARTAPVSALLARDRPTSNKPDVNITFTSSRYGLTETWPLSPQAGMTETSNIPAHTGIRRVQHAAIRLRIRITCFSVAPRVWLSLVALARSECWTPRSHHPARHQRLPVDEAGLPSRLPCVDRRFGHLHRSSSPKREGPPPTSRREERGALERTTPLSGKGSSPFFVVRADPACSSGFTH